MVVEPDYNDRSDVLSLDLTSGSYRNVPVQKAVGAISYCTYNLEPYCSQGNVFGGVSETKSYIQSVGSPEESDVQSSDCYRVVTESVVIPLSVSVTEVEVVSDGSKVRSLSVESVGRPIVEPWYRHPSQYYPTYHCLILSESDQDLDEEVLGWDTTSSKPGNY